MWTNHWNLATICSIAIVAKSDECSSCGHYLFNWILWWICFLLPIQNGIFLFICSIEYCGEFAFRMPIQNGIFFNLAIAPHTVQLNECVWSTSESIRQLYWNRQWYTADCKRFAVLLHVCCFSGTVCDIALSHTGTGSKPCPMQNTIPIVFFSGNVWDTKRKAHVTLATTVDDT